MISQISQLAANWRLTITTTSHPPTINIKNLFIQKQIPFDVCLQNVHTFDRCATRAAKGVRKKNRRDRLNLKK